MARNRTIKPEFWTSDQIVECSRDARLLFIGIWNFADDGGVMPAKPKSIKMKVFPGEDDLDSGSVRAMLDELSANGLIHEYTVDGQPYLHVTGWAEHQRIDRPTAKYPGPHQAHSTNARRGLVEPSSPEGKGEEGKGGDRKGSARDDESPRAAAASPPDVNKRAPPTDDRIVERLPLNDHSEHPVTAGQIAEYQRLYPAVDVAQALRSMRGWCDANPAKRKTRRGVANFITRWLAREQDRGRSPPAYAPYANGGRPVYARNQAAAEQATRELQEEFARERH